jgi:electron transport complex protein RnfD
MADRRFELTASPHIKGSDTTPKIMWSVVASLVPVIAAAIYWFGPSAALVIGSATVGCIATERVFGPGGTLRDGSAAITGLLLGLTLPAGIPLWMAFFGGMIAIGLGKLIFGGLGQNVFNPALLGRAMLQAAFPEDMTAWPAPTERWAQLRGDNFAFPFMSADDAVTVTSATPLGQMKFEQIPTEAMDLLLGATGGSTGETAALVILLGGVYLALRKHLNWRIPVSILLTVAVLSQVIHQIAPERYPDAVFMLLSGGLMLGAWYMATDMVTSPTTNGGCWLYGLGIGTLVVVIRLWGGLPEGVMYSILLMNALVPFINRATQPRVFGTGREAVAS